MNICILTTTFPRWKGDTAGLFILTQAEALIKRGHTVTVVCPSTQRGHQWAPTMSGLTVKHFRYAPWSWLELTSGGGVLPSLRRRPWLWLIAPFFFASAARTVRTVAATADVIHAHWLPNGFIALLATTGAARPVVVTIHGSDLTVRAVWLRSLARFVLRRATAVIAVSTFVRQTAVKFGCPSENLYLIPTPVADIDHWTSMTVPPRGRHRLIWIGRLIPEKRPALVLEIFRQIHQYYPDAHLDMVGDGPERPVLEQAVSGNLGQAVTFHGHIDRPELHRVMDGADILLNTSPQEGFGLTVLEALLAGRPVVAADHPAVREFMIDGRHGVIIPSSDQELNQFVSAIDRLFQDDQVRRRYAETDRAQLAQRYRPEAIASQLSHLYRDLLVAWPVRYWQRRHQRFGGSWRSIGCQRFTERANRYMYRIVRERYATVLDFLQLTSHPTVLDAGAGTGAYIDMLLDRQAQITATDVSAEALQQLHDRFPAVRTKLGSIAGLDLPPGTFDLVQCFDVLYHVLDDDAWRQSITTLANSSRRYIAIHGTFPATRPRLQSLHVRTRSYEEYDHLLQQLGFTETISAGTHTTAMRFPWYYLQNIMPQLFYWLDKRRLDQLPGRLGPTRGHAIKVFSRQV